MSLQLLCEWGEAGLRAIAAACDVIVIVDVLSFSTCVDVAVARGVEVLPFRWRGEGAASHARKHAAVLARTRGEGGVSLSPASFASLPAGTRVVLPSPNGATLSVAAREHTVLAGCLRNASAVAAAAAARGSRVGVVPAGERWPDGGLRPALEDWLGAGAVLAALPGRLSPEARAAVAAFREHRDALESALLAIPSGRELVAGGYRDDVLVAAAFDVSAAAPCFDGLVYRASGADGSPRGDGGGPDAPAVS